MAAGPFQSGPFASLWTEKAQLKQRLVQMVHTVHSKIDILRAKTPCPIVLAPSHRGAPARARKSSSAKSMDRVDHGHKPLTDIDFFPWPCVDRYGPLWTRADLRAHRTFCRASEGFNKLGRVARQIVVSAWIALNAQRTVTHGRRSERAAW